jgi:hypothetical protein
MKASQSTQLIVAVFAHGAAAIAMAVLVILPTRAMALYCIVPGVLIGCTGVAALRGRPITLYAAFGVLMGYVFWYFVSAVNQGEFVVLIPILLLAAAVTWLLHSPDWPSVIFTGVVILLLVGLTLLMYRQRTQLDDPERVVSTTATGLVMLCVGLMYVGVGFWEESLRRSKKSLRKKRRRSIPEEA